MDGHNINGDVTIGTSSDLNALLDAKMKEYTDNLTNILRSRKDITRQDIEEKYGISNLNRHGILVKGNPWEQGKRPSLEIILKIALAFNIPLGTIFVDDTESDSSDFSRELLDTLKEIGENRNFANHVIAQRIKFKRAVAKAKDEGRLDENRKSEIAGRR